MLDVEANIDKDRIQEIGINLDESFFKADHYLPGDYYGDIWNYALGNHEQIIELKSLKMYTIFILLLICNFQKALKII